MKFKTTLDGASLTVLIQVKSQHDCRLNLYSYIINSKLSNKYVS